DHGRLRGHLHRRRRRADHLDPGALGTRTGDGHAHPPLTRPTWPGTWSPTTATRGPPTSGTTTRCPAARLAPGTTTAPAEPGRRGQGSPGGSPGNFQMPGSCG